MIGAWLSWDWKDKMLNEQIIHIRKGITVAIRKPIYQQKFWLRGQFYEQKMLNYIHQRYHGGTFIDGGACIGNHTLWFMAFCAGQVIAVEPVAYNVAYLRRNLTLSNLESRVTIIEAALGSHPGLGSMEHFSPLHSHYALTNGDDVIVTTLDEVAKKATYPISLVKLDIEGGELAALEGALDLLTKQGPALFIELKTKPEQDTVNQFLSNLGYVMGRRFNKSPTFEFRKVK